MTSDWPLVPLGDVVDMKSGFAFKSHEFLKAGTVRLARGANISQGRFDWSNIRYWPDELRDDHEDYELAEGDVVLAMDRPWIESGLKYARVNKRDLPALLVQRVARLRARPEHLDQTYLYFALGTPEFTQHVLAMQTGTTIPHISGTQIGGYKFDLPPLHEQRAIVEVLGALDDSMETCRGTQVAALAVAQACWDAATAEHGEQLTVDEVAEFENRRRIPLSSRERAARPGPFPYYGATGIFGHVDDFLFEGPRVLVGEDGSVVNEDGTAVVQYPWGRFWVNNHAHVLVPKTMTVEQLYLTMRRTSVQGFVTGAAQPKLSMGRLKQVPLSVPNAGAVEQLREVVDSLFATYRGAAEEARTSAELLDTLLPELLSGRLRVDNPEHLLAGAA